MLRISFYNYTGLNIFKYIQEHLLSSFEFGTIYLFRFESFEVTFSQSVIPAIFLSSHALFLLHRFQQVYSLFTGILDAPGRMKYHSFSKRSVPVRHPDGRDYGIGQVRDTSFHWLILMKLTIQQIWRHLMVVRGFRRHFESSG